MSNHLFVGGVCVHCMEQESVSRWFCYGAKKEDGQYERYPTLEDRESVDMSKIKVPPWRRTYVHNKCGVATKIGEDIAKTYEANPKFYSHTFCVGCKEHRPVGEFKWDDGVTVGDFG